MSLIWLKGQLRTNQKIEGNTLADKLIWVLYAMTYAMFYMIEPLVAYWFVGSALAVEAVLFCLPNTGGD